MSRIAGALKKGRGGENPSPDNGSPSGEREGSGRGTSEHVEHRPRSGSVPWQLGDAGGEPPRPTEAASHSDERGSLVRRRRDLPGEYRDSASPRRPASPPPSEPSPLLHYWDVAKRRWLTALVVLLVVVSGVVAGVMLETPVYRATGLIEIRRESATAVPVETLFTSEKVASDDLETQYGILKSQALAERVLAAVAQYKAADPDSRSDMPHVASGGTSTADAPEPPTQRAIEKFRQALVVNPYKGSRLVEVGFSSPHPRLAAFTVNSVLDNYLQLRMEEAARSAKWLEQQLEAAQHRLENSERQLQAYVGQHGLQVVETGKGETTDLANERLQALHEALAAAQAERIEKQSADEQARQLAASRSADSPVVQSLSVKLADLRREQAKLASVFKEDYPAVKTLNDQIAELERALAEESRLVVARGQRDYRAAVRKEALLRTALEQQNAVVQALGARSEGAAGYPALRRELVTNQEQFAALSQKLKDVSISAALKATNVGIVDRAKPPLKPYGTALPVTLTLSVVVGLFVAVGAMFLREHFDTSMRTVADVQAYLGVRPLGAIPAVEARPRLMPLPSREPSVLARQWRRIDDRGERQSALGEAFATLRNAILLQDGAAASRVLLVTSAQSAEGKTTVSVNLALSLARLNYRVLLIDGNMRYPCVQRALGLPDRPGLVEYLAQGVDWRSSVHAKVQPNLDVLGGDEPQTSPADLLSLPWMGRLLDEASQDYDYVIVDSPAILPHPADVHSLAAVVDAVLFTIRQGFAPRAAVSLALSQLDRVSGVVLNRSDSPDLALHPTNFARGPAPDSPS